MKRVNPNFDILNNHEFLKNFFLIQKLISYISKGRQKKRGI